MGLRGALTDTRDAFQTYQLLLAIWVGWVFCVAGSPKEGKRGKGGWNVRPLEYEIFIRQRGVQIRTRMLLMRVGVVACVLCGRKGGYELSRPMRWLAMILISSRSFSDAVLLCHATS